MTKISQTSFAARIGKAETLFNTLNGFDGYAPGDPDLTPHGIKVRIDALYGLQQSHATNFNAFTTAVQARQQLFKGERPLSKTMTMVRSYVMAAYGKQSDKAKNVDTIVSKIRGERPAKITRASGEGSISRTEKSYGAQHVNLVYLITTLSGFGNTYAPANPLIKIDALTALANEIRLANDEAVLTYQAYHPVTVNRRKAFDELAEVIQRVKLMVLSQYGSGSLEYKAVKGMNFKHEKL